MFIDLFVDGEGRGSTDNCGGIFTTKETSTAVSSYSSPSLSNYTRTTGVKIFCFYSTPNDCIYNYF